MVVPHASGSTSSSRSALANALTGARSQRTARLSPHRQNQRPRDLHERRQQRLPLGNTPSEPCRLLTHRIALGYLQQNVKRRQLMVSIPYSGPVRRIHNILHLLKRSTHNAPMQQLCRIRFIHCNQCHCRNRTSCSWLCPDEIIGTYSANSLVV